MCSFIEHQPRSGRHGDFPGRRLRCGSDQTAAHAAARRCFAVDSIHAVPSGECADSRADHQTGWRTDLDESDRY